MPKEHCGKNYTVSQLFSSISLTHFNYIRKVYTASISCKNPFQIIHLTRDPRGMFHSRSQTDWSRAKNIAYGCNEVRQDLVLEELLPAKRYIRGGAFVWMNVPCIALEFCRLHFGLNFVTIEFIGHMWSIIAIEPECYVWYLKNIY